MSTPGAHAHTESKAPARKRAQRNWDTGFTVITTALTVDLPRLLYGKKGEKAKNKGEAYGVVRVQVEKAEVWDRLFPGCDVPTVETLETWITLWEKEARGRSSYVRLAVRTCARLRFRAHGFAHARNDVVHTPAHVPAHYSRTEWWFWRRRRWRRSVHAP